MPRACLGPAKLSRRNTLVELEPFAVDSTHEWEGKQGSGGLCNKQTHLSLLTAHLLDT